MKRRELLFGRSPAARNGDEGELAGPRGLLPHRRHLTPAREERLQHTLVALQVPAREGVERNGARARRVPLRAGSAAPAVQDHLLLRLLLNLDCLHGREQLEGPRSLLPRGLARQITPLREDDLHQFEGLAVGFTNNSTI